MEKHLKAKGIRKTLSALHKVTRGPLHRAKVALEKTSPTSFDSEYLSNSGQVHPNLDERLSSLPALSDDDQELSQCGCWSQQFQVKRKKKLF